jgi:hypothetical protein
MGCMIRGIVALELPVFVHHHFSPLIPIICDVNNFVRFDFVIYLLNGLSKLMCNQLGALAHPHQAYINHRA